MGQPNRGARSEGGRESDLVEARLRAALHDIRQPLATVFALAECIRCTLDLPPSAQDWLSKLVAEVQHIGDAVTGALDPAAGTGADGGSSLVRLDEVVDDVLESYALTWTGRLVRSGRQEAWVQGRWHTLRRCVANVVDNAVRAAGPDGLVVVTLREGPDRVHVFVDDDGPGFGRVGPGLGIGLDATRRALGTLGGTVTIDTRVRGGGTRVVLSLPALHQTATTTAPVRAG
jgi:signal transduction histidine kinase